MSSVQADQESFFPSNREATIASQATEESISNVEIQRTDAPPSQLVSTLDTALGNLERNLSAHERMIRSNLNVSLSDMRPTSMASSTFSEQEQYSAQERPPRLVQTISDSGHSQDVEQELESLKIKFDKVQDLMRVKDGRFQEALVLVEDLSARCAYLTDQVQELKSSEASITATAARLRTSQMQQVASLNAQLEEMQTQLAELSRPKVDPDAERLKQREAVLEMERKSRQEAVERQKLEILNGRQRVMEGARMNVYKNPTSTGKPVWSRIDVVNGSLSLRWGDWKTGMGGAAPPMTNSEPIVAVRSEKVGQTLQMVFVTPKREVRMSVDDQTQHKAWIDVRLFLKKVC
jgi:hypothetical protein